MKIKSIEARWLHVPIPEAEQHRSDFGLHTSFDTTLVRIETDTGLVGWGEAKAAVGGTGAYGALTHIINTHDNTGYDHKKGYWMCPDHHFHKRWWWGKSGEARVLILPNQNRRSW